MNYTISQIDKVIAALRVDKEGMELVSEGYKPTIEISFNGVTTKHLNITPEQVEKIRQVLIEG